MPESNRAAREGYRQFRQDALDLFFSVDPAGINFGSNTDEYEPEVDSVLPRLRSCTEQAHVRTMLQEELDRWFGAGEYSRLDELAEQLWGLWQIYYVPPK